MINPVIIGNATLYHGDCLEILPTLGKVDAVVTDPPYGIGEAAGKNQSRGKPFGSRADSKNTKGTLVPARNYGSDCWDNKPCSPEQITAMREASKTQVIFGGNYFNLPPSSCWLVWDKDNSGDFADAELAWTNIKGAVRLKKWRWNGMLQENMKNKETRVHPTQKPVPIMEWAIQQSKTVGTVLDPFMGSGTTGVACMNLGRKFIGIEIEQKYFDIACERIEQAQRQQRLFA